MEQTELTLRKVLLLVAGLVLLVAGIRGKFGSTLAVLLTPTYLEEGNSNGSS